MQFPPLDSVSVLSFSKTVDLLNQTSDYMLILAMNYSRKEGFA